MWHQIKSVKHKSHLATEKGREANGWRMNFYAVGRAKGKRVVGQLEKNRRWSWRCEQKSCQAVGVQEGAQLLVWKKLDLV